MSLESGTRLGPYEITAPIGAGGMGEVYRARDTRLDRTVAIKVLPPEFVSDEGRRQRFQREARAVSALSHPHICAIFDVGHEGDVDFFVMEHLEGESLAQRMKRGQLPVGSALNVAGQIADALHAAHRAGIVHRDLKPGNVMLTSAGAKLLDFGLAKQRQEGPADEHSALPTASVAEPLTGEGAVLGTLPYMAPEQVEGRDVDARTDIFALGTMLYEMLAGKRPFEGKSTISLAGAILEHDPAPLASLVPLAPASLDHVVGRCLAKDPDDRWQSASDVAHELRWVASRRDEEGASSNHERRPRGAALPWMAAWLVALGVGLLVGRGSTGASKSAPGPTVRSIVPLPERTQLAGWASPVVALSPDGSTLAFVAVDAEGRQQLYVQRMDEIQATVVPDSEEAEGPFFAPDGQWVGFATSVSGQSGRAGALRKFSLATGLTQVIAPIDDYFGASWSETGSIVFAEVLSDGLKRVDAAGGEVESLISEFQTDDGPRRSILLWPQLMPDGRTVLATSTDHSVLGRAVSIDLETGRLRDLGIEGSGARYVPTGHLLYLGADAALMAVPFDAERAEPTGAEVALIRDVAFAGGSAPVIAASHGGSFVYATGYLRGSGRELSRLATVSREGAVQPLPYDADTFLGRLSIAADGRRLALSTWPGSAAWVYDFDARARTRLPLGPRLLEVGTPLWSPDSQRIAFSGFAAGGEGLDIYLLAADGSADPELALSAREESYAYSWTHEGRSLLIEGVRPGEWNIRRLDLDGGQAEEVLFPDTDNQRTPRLSPDGRWLAYSASESKDWNVYVRPYPGPGSKVAVSRAGGRDPQWSPDGRELFFREGNGFYSAGMKTTPSLEIGEPTLLFESDLVRSYDVLPDGSGFIVLERLPESGIQTQLHLVTNWFEELKRLVPID